ncbi:hypothetical protein ACFWDI_12420 [Streptomyces sp. NPDC060064]|uniref:hypothetical protein n=1 Tax=Streptomyces sp. NPDC060064 TaxID=3347049 RepID=UPI0036C34072
MTTSPDTPDISVAPDAAHASEPGSYVARLPIGEPLPLADHSLTRWETFPFTGELRVKPLTAPALPEPPRSGEGGPGECRTCASPVEESLRADDHWRLDAVGDQDRLSAVVMLRPHSHHTFTDLSAERAEELLPQVPGAERRAARIRIAASLAAGGGTAYAR